MTCSLVDAARAADSRATADKRGAEGATWSSLRPKIDEPPSAVTHSDPTPAPGTSTGCRRLRLGGVVPEGGLRAQPPAVSVPDWNDGGKTTGALPLQW